MPAWLSWARWKESEEGGRPSLSAMSPAASPAGPRSTRRRNMANLVSWARADSAGIACFEFMVHIPRREFLYFQYHRIIGKSIAAEKDVDDISDIGRCFRRWAAGGADRLPLSPSKMFRPRPTAARESISSRSPQGRDGGDGDRPGGSTSAHR